MDVTFHSCVTSVSKELGVSHTKVFEAAAMFLVHQNTEGAIFLSSTASMGDTGAYGTNLWTLKM